MKKFVVFFILLVTSVSFAESGANSIANADDVKSNTLLHLGSMKITQEEKENVRKTVEGLVRRTMAMQTVEVLEEKGFSKDGIRVVLESAEFKLFTQRVVDDPRVTQAIDALIGRLLAPPVVIANNSEKEAKEGAERQYAIQKYLLENSLSFADKKPEAPPSLWAQLWSKTQRFLFE